MSQPATATAAASRGAAIHNFIGCNSSTHYTLWPDVPFQAHAFVCTKIRAMDGYVPLPPLPARISRLNDLACDLWWSWNAEGREVFRDLDLPLWRFTDHNPVLLLHLVDPERLDHAAGDEEF